MKIRLSAEAESDLEAIGLFIARDNPARAVSFILELREKCLTLADLPRGYPRVVRYGGGEMRRRIHRNYVIFYLIDGDEINVARVIHGARDYADILFAD